MLAAAFAWLVEQLQREIDLAEKAFNFVALLRVGIGLQPFKQLKLSRKEFGKGCYCASHAGRNVS